LYGLFGQQNLGNDCTLRAAIDAVRQYVPQVSVECVCTGPEDVAARHGISAFSIRPTPMRPLSGPTARVRRLVRQLVLGIPREIRHWFRAFSTMKSASMFIAPGTGLITDWGTSPLGRPYDLFKWCTVARLRGCRIVFLSVGVGPIFHPMSRWLFKSALALSDYRTYRDAASKEYITRVGLAADEDRVYPDLVFGMSPAALPTCSKNGARAVVGVGIMDYYGERGRDERTYSEYLTKTTEFVRWLVEHGYTVRILIGDAFYDLSPRRALRETLETVGAAFEPGQIIDEEINSIDQLLLQIAKCDVVVSPRFHNLLMALLLNKPTISLSYNEKSTALMSVVGLSDYCQDIDTFEVDLLTRQLSELIGKAAAIRPALEKRVEAFRVSVSEQYELVFGEMS
jgi:polysaccharide pyruvyl transferase WcaK-like protein